MLDNLEKIKSRNYLFIIGKVSYSGADPGEGLIPPPSR